MATETIELQRLVYNSAEDLRVHLNFYKSQNAAPELPILQEAYAVCLAKGYKTKAKLIASAIKRTAIYDDKNKTKPYYPRLPDQN